MSILIHPTYFPNTAHVLAMVSSKYVTFEVCDNYQKQTYRNRCEIYGANGRLALTIPVSYTQKHRQHYKDVKVSKSENWQSQHLKSLESAYKMSPFYEYYIDDLMPIFKTDFDYLLDINLRCFELLTDAIDIIIDYSLTEKYVLPNEEVNDYRHLTNTKKSKEFNFEAYTQVFTEKHGYLQNLSILDLLFNEGPNLLNYLEKQNLGI